MHYCVFCWRYDFPSEVEREEHMLCCDVRLREILVGRELMREEREERERSRMKRQKRKRQDNAAGEVQRSEAHGNGEDEGKCESVDAMFIVQKMSREVEMAKMYCYDAMN